LTGNNAVNVELAGMRRASLLLLLAVAFVAGCGGSSGGGTSPSGRSSSTTKRVAPERRPAPATVLGVASRYVDSRVAGGRLPRVHVGRAGVVGKVAVVYLVGGSDVAGGAAGRSVKGLYGVLVLARRGGAWRVEPPAIAFGGHS
jgi:hypothetical protein